MADGVTHAQAADRAILAGVAVAGVAVATSVIHPIPAAILVAGLVLGKYASSDVRDQEQVTNHPEHLVYQQWGLVPGAIWQGIWWPLAKKLPHRSPHSHLPVWATAIAWLWLFTLPLIISALLGWTMFAIVFSVAVLLFPGWVVQDYVHLYLDGGFKAIRW